MSSANWHWKQLDCTRFAKEYFNEKLVGLKVNDDLTIMDLKECDGDVTLGQRKSKLVTIYDLRILIEWSSGELTGKTLIPEVSHEAIDGLDEYVFDSSLTKGDDYNKFNKIKNDLLPNVLKPIFDKFPQDLCEKYGSHVQVPNSSTNATTNNNTSTTTTNNNNNNTTIIKTEKVEVKEKKPTSKSLNTSTVTVEERYMISSNEFFEILTNKDRVPMWTRAPAEIEPKVGSNITLFGGGVKGKIKEIETGKKVVMDWTLTGGKWPEGHVAILTIDLKQSDDSTYATFSLDGVPTGLEEDIQGSLENYYIKPLKLLFGTIL